MEIQQIFWYNDGGQIRQSDRPPKNGVFIQEQWSQNPSGIQTMHRFTIWPQKKRSVVRAASGYDRGQKKMAFLYKHLG